MALLPPPSRIASNPPPTGGVLTLPEPVTVDLSVAAAAHDVQIELESLLSAMEAMPTNPSVAMRVLWIADDPQTNTPALATTIELDPALSARILRVANSAFYSRGNRVTSVGRAVISVGFATVQALAAAAVTGLDENAHVPTNFWDHAATVAHASSLVARHFGTGANEAFAAGLLHDIGEGVLCQIDPEGWAQIEDLDADGPARLEAERLHFGATHDDVASRILRAWHLPDQLVTAVATHHGSGSTAGAPLSALSETLVCGEAFAEIVNEYASGLRADDARRTLHEAGVTDTFIERVGPRLAEETAALTEVLAS